MPTSEPLHKQFGSDMEWRRIQSTRKEVRFEESFVFEIGHNPTRFGFAHYGVARLGVGRPDRTTAGGYDESLTGGGACTAARHGAIGSRCSAHATDIFAIEHAGAADPVAL